MEKMFYNTDKILLINETFIIDHGIHEHWYKLVHKELIPAMKESGLIQDVILSKIKGGFNPDGENYALQFKVSNNTYPSFKENEIVNNLRFKMNETFRNKFGSFVTELEIVVY